MPKRKHPFPCTRFDFCSYLIISFNLRLSASHMYMRQYLTGVGGVGQNGALSLRTVDKDDGLKVTAQVSLPANFSLSDSVSFLFVSLPPAPANPATLQPASHICFLTRSLPAACRSILLYTFLHSLSFGSQPVSHSPDAHRRSTRCHSFTQSSSQSASLSIAPPPPRARTHNSDLSHSTRNPPPTHTHIPPSPRLLLQCLHPTDGARLLK